MKLVHRRVRPLEAAQRLALVSWPILSRQFAPDCCIAATKIGLEVPPVDLVIHSGVMPRTTPVKPTSTRRSHDDAIEDAVHVSHSYVFRRREGQLYMADALRQRWKARP